MVRMVFRFKSNVESTLSAFFFFSGSVQFTFYQLDRYDRLRCKKVLIDRFFYWVTKNPAAYSVGSAS